MAKGNVNGSYLMYQGKPLIRQDNAYVWGDMNDRAVLFLLVLTNKEMNGRQVPDDILIQVISTEHHRVVTVDIHRKRSAGQIAADATA